MSDLTTTSVAVWVLLPAAISAALTAWARRYALKKSLLDIPNDRSSHQIPTVRGGGISIVVCSLIAGVGLWAAGLVSGAFALAWSGGALVAWIGWLDDHGHISPAWRALCHFVAASWAVAWLGGMPTLNIGATAIPLAAVGHVLAIVGIVWLINLFNFMDGIDGIAGSEGTFVAIAGGVLLWFGGSAGLAILSLIVAAACIGFLVWNWPPAKIFMGDVGSGTLGFFVAVLALASERFAAVPLLVWVILCGVFVCDATFTLLRRVANGERWYSAHRSHAYQRLVQMGRTHLSVTVLVSLANITVLFPMALVGWAIGDALLPMVILMCAAGFVTWASVQRRFSAHQQWSRSET